MTQEESVAINKKWDKILGEHYWMEFLPDELSAEVRADIDWIYGEAYDASIQYLESACKRIKVSEFFEGDEFQDYCVDAGDELRWDKIRAFGVEELLNGLEGWVKGGYDYQDDYQDYHQRIRELKPMMLNC